MGAMASSFDVGVFGCGPGGYVPALRAAQPGASTAIVEKDRMGGTCLVRGCIPTKALLQSTELYSLAKAGAAFGLVTGNVGFDWPTAQKRKTQVVDQLVKGVEGLLKAGGVTSLRGAARLAGKGQVAIDGESITAKDIVIATGSTIARIPLKGAELTIDSDRILELRDVPARLAVIGGGVVGMEFAAMFAALGTKVTVLEMLPQVLPMVDADLVTAYAKHLAGLGGVASYEGVCAVANIAGHGNRVPDYHAAPNCVYTDPEIAHVGLGEKEAKDKGLDVRVGRFPFAASGRALTLGQSEGFAKVIADAGSGKLLGAHIIGPRATDLIAEATLAIQNGLTLEQLDLTIHAHPTLPESLMEAALAAQGRAIHIPNKRSSPAPQPEQSNNQNQEKQMVAPVKSSSPPPTPSAINPRSLELTKQNRDFLLGLHRQMQLIRRFEERAQEQYTKAKIGGYCHLNIGEEATVVGGILALKANDWIFTSYPEP